MQILPEPGKGRPLALILALMVAVLVYLVCFNWFLTGHASYMMQARDLRAAEQQFLRTIAQREELNAALEQVRRLEQSNQAFLPEDSFDLAAAALTGRIRQMIQEHANDPATCQLLTHNPSRSREPELYTRVTIKARILCDLGDFWQVLHAIENSSPALMVDEVQVLRMSAGRARGAAPMGRPAGVGADDGGRLDIRIDIYGYILQRGNPS